MSDQKEPKYGKILEGVEQLSLGISIVVAIVLGVGIGILLKNTFGHTWLLWVGVFWGVAGAGLNIKRAYDKQKADLDSLKDDPRYKHAKPSTKEDDDEDDQY